MTSSPIPSASLSGTSSQNLHGNNHEQRMFQVQARIIQNQQKLGWIGRIFGSSKEKAGNIACIAIIFSFLLIPVIIFFTPAKDENVSKDRFLNIPTNIITLSLGYLFVRTFLKSKP